MCAAEEKHTDAVVHTHPLTGFNNGTLLPLTGRVQLGSGFVTVL